MSNNFYGGFFYPGTPFIFDKIYSNYTEAQNNCADDEVLVGHYILIKYSETAFTSSEKAAIIGGSTSVQGDYQNFLSNFEEDGGNEKDRVVFRKGYKNDKYFYEEITNLSIDDKAITNTEINNAIAQAVIDIENTLREELKSQAAIWQPLPTISNEEVRQ